MAEFWKPTAQQIVKRIVLEGKVQKVGCRAQVMGLVIGIGHINGFVRNMDDGRVELCVKGDDWRIEDLIKILRRKMYPPVVVERVLTEDLGPEDIERLAITNGFVIRRGQN